MITQKVPKWIGTKAAQVTCASDLRGAFLYIEIAIHVVPSTLMKIDKRNKIRYTILGKLNPNPMIMAAMKHMPENKDHGTRGLIPVNIILAIFTFFLLQKALRLLYHTLSN